MSERPANYSCKVSPQRQESDGERIVSLEQRLATAEANATKYHASTLIALRWIDKMLGRKEGTTVETMKPALGEVEAAMGQMGEALEFYADPDNWVALREFITDEGPGTLPLLMVDNGRNAGDALATDAGKRAMEERERMITAFRAWSTWVETPDDEALLIACIKETRDIIDKALGKGEKDAT